MPIKLTASQRANLLQDYVNGTDEMRAEIRATYPELFPSPDAPESTAVAKADPNDWTKPIGLKRVLKQRSGYELLITFVCEIEGVEFRVVLDIGTLMDAKMVRNRLIAATERVPIMPAAKDWPAAVEHMLANAERIEADQISREEWIIGQIGAYLATGIQQGDTTGTRDSNLFEIVGGSGAVHGVLDTVTAGERCVIIHQEPLTTWIAKRAEMDRKSLEQLIKAHLPEIFDPYRIPGGKGRRGYWRQRVEILEDRHGIELPFVSPAAES